MYETEGTEDPEAALARALREIEGEMRVVGAKVQALPEGHPRRPLLLANYRQALALLTDMPRLLGR